MPVNRVVAYKVRYEHMSEKLNIILAEIRLAKAVVGGI